LRWTPLPWVWGERNGANRQGFGGSKAMSRLLDETEAGAALDLHIQSVATPLSRTWYVDASGEVARLSKAELTLTDLNLECLLDIRI
jgi:hypothetical protein